MIKPEIKLEGEAARKLGRKWIDRVEAASKFEKNWLDDAKTAQSVYTGDTTEKDGAIVRSEKDRYDFNILFANVETIVPAVINSPPVPDIRRRFGETDPAARVLAQIIERAIQVQIDDSRLQIELEAAAQDAFLAGRGIIRQRFRSDFVGEPTDDAIEDAAEDADNRGSESEGYLRQARPNGIEPEAGDEAGYRPELQRSNAMDGQQPSVTGQDDYLAGGQADNAGQPVERVENERITFEAVPWIDYRHGPAKRWDERPWDAFRFCIPQEELDGEFFDRKLIDTQLSDQERNERTNVTSAEGELTGWEIWDKAKREVLFIRDNGCILKRVKDPLGLANFFCIPTPMQPIEVNGRLTPVNPFVVYATLARDLEDAVRRKRRLIDAMKAKGWYAASAGDMASIIDKDDNEFVPFKDLDAISAAGGIEKAIAFWPVERFMAVIQQLDAAIGQYKQWIYEITGISDIIRGASNAAETATAQNIKSQWGSLRIQKMQRMMERTARELFIMMSEIIPSKFSIPTLERMTGISIQPTPQDDQNTIKTKMAVMELMKQPLAQYYRIDVESDSTVRADLTRQKQELAGFLQSASSYFAAVGPLVKEGTMPADAAAEIFAASARMFNLGRSVEDTVENMINKAKEMAGQPPKPDPRQQAEEQKQAMEAEKAQAANAKTMADSQKAQADAAKTAAEAQKIAADAEATRQQTEQRYAEAARKAQADGIAAQQQAIIDELVRDIKALERDIKQIELDKAQVGLEHTQVEAMTKPIVEAHTATMEIV